MQVKEILTSLYCIEPDYIIDNKYCKYNPDIKPVSFFDDIDCSKYKVILASTNRDIYCELKKELLKRFESVNILELESMSKITICGRHSYGPLCSHHLVESVGSFSCFAVGTDVVVNHPVDMISVHPFMYAGEPMGFDYEGFKINSPQWYIPGIFPRGSVHKTKDNRRRIAIGSDVWLGKNVIITNGSNIGNGVIAGAGTIITKDIPDYAVVVGNPSRIIRYRFTPDQIEGLNRIKWWDWSDETIRDRYDDFYLPIDEFIEKYLKKQSNKVMEDNINLLKEVF